jgi:hypothetical protein
MCYDYRNLSSVMNACTYDLGISNIHQFKPRLQVSNTRDNKKHMKMGLKAMGCESVDYGVMAQHRHK